MQVASRSDVGRVRKNNEDNLLIDEHLGLLIVADGMGGYAGGEVASAIAVDVLAGHVRECLPEPLPAERTTALLQAAVRAADEAICTKARVRRAVQHMGTTVVLALCQADRVYIAHVGDSRAYLLHQGELCQLTEDHSVVAQLIKAGQLTPEEAGSHPLRHVITRHLGSGGAVADLSSVTWQRGDYLLLCSDGLSNMVDDHDMAALILRGGSDVRATCEALVALANANGGEDNISVILAHLA